MKRHLSYLVAFACTVSAYVASAADHREAPALVNSANVGALDLNDIYVFRSPANKNNTVLMMTVNPFAGVLSPDTLDDSIYYELVIDNDGDAREDLVYRFSYLDIPVLNAQLVIVTRLDKRSLLGQLGIGLYVAVGFTGSNLRTIEGGTTTTGVFDDPFFFDLNGFGRLQNGTGTFDGTDFFDQSNISAIVLEVPSKSLLAPVPRFPRGQKANPNIGVWARTVGRGTLGFGIDGEQFDRTGLPAIATALIPAGQRRNDFNAGQPVDDRNEFSNDVKIRADFLSGLAGFGPPHPARDAIANLVLPDILPFNTTSAAGFLNGRRLADDVIDAELNLLTSPAPFMQPGVVSTDGVDANDKPFRTRFPYLAAPHRMPEPNPLP